MATLIRSKFKVIIVILTVEFLCLGVIGWGVFVYGNREKVEIHQVRTKEFYFDVFPYYRGLEVNEYVVNEIQNGNFAEVVTIYNQRIRDREVVTLILLRATEFEIPVNLLFGLIDVESGFKKDAVSEAGAVGLMQLMPRYFKHRKREELFNIYINTTEGCRYLTQRYKRYGSWIHALYYYYGVGKTTLDYVAKVIATEQYYDVLFNNGRTDLLFQQGYQK